MNDDLDLTLYADAAELADVVANEAIEIIALTLLEKGVCHVALTGGSLGEDFSAALVSRINGLVDLSGLNIWFSDERFVSKDSPLRNSRTVLGALNNSTVIIHEVAAAENGLTVQEAAAKYDSELLGLKMDICVLGLGPDGHVASLFPEHWDVTQEQGAVGKAVAIVDSPKPPAERVSFSMSFINSSAQVWIIAAGEAKAKAVTQVLESEPSVPAGHVMASEITRLVVDTEAFFTE
jgi:6-phosphogluconolactonase